MEALERAAAPAAHDHLKFPRPRNPVEPDGDSDELAAFRARHPEFSPAALAVLQARLPAEARGQVEAAHWFGGTASSSTSSEQGDETLDA